MNKTITLTSSALKKYDIIIMHPVNKKQKSYFVSEVLNDTTVTIKPYGLINAIFFFILKITKNISGCFSRNKK